MSMSLRLFVLTFALTLAVGSASASVFTFSATAATNSSPDANGTVDAWTTGPSSSDNGFFTGNSASNGFSGSAAGAGGNAWAMWAKNGALSNSISNTFSSLTAGAITSLSQVGDYVSLDFDNGEINGDGQVAVQFMTAADTVVSTLRFTGGDTVYRIDDSTAGSSTGVGFTANGFTLKLTMTDSMGGYTMSLGGTNVTGRVLGGGGGPIAKINVYNASAGPDSPRDLYFNNLTIAATVPESPASALMPIAASISAAIGVYWRRIRRLATV